MAPYSANVSLKPSLSPRTNHEAYLAKTLKQPHCSLEFDGSSQVQAMTVGAVTASSTKEPNTQWCPSALRMSVLCGDQAASACESC